MFSVRALFSEICRETQCSINSVLSQEHTDRFRHAVGEILLTKEIYFSRQIIFKHSAQLFIFFDGSLQGYGACVYAHSNDQFNLLYSSAKVLGKTAYSVPQSEIAGATLAARMEQKIRQELFNVTLSAPIFVGDSEIVLKMIAKNDPAGPPVFYGTRLMEILSTSSPDNWFWCPGTLNPADLLTKSGTECKQINCEFWLQGSFLPKEKSTWPIIACTSLPTSDTCTRMVNIVNLPVNQSQDLITHYLEHSQSLNKVVRAITLLHKVCRAWRARKNPNPAFTWSKIKDSISSSIIKCFIRTTESIIASNKMKHLVVQNVEGVYYVSDRSFRSRVGVPLICKTTILAKCIVNDAHSDLGHGRDVLHTISHIQTSFFIPGVRKMITDLKKSCPGCIKLSNKPFSAFKADVPDVLKTIQPPFTYCQADIFGPIFAHQDGQNSRDGC